MGSSLVKGMLSNQWPAEQITICEQNPARRKWLTSEFSDCHIVENCATPIAPASVVVLAVKPQDMRSICRQISANQFSEETLFISIAAGISTQAITQWLNTPASIVRCMPNTPAAIGHGITGLYADANTPSEDKKCAQEILTGAGRTLWVQDEAMLDAVTALSGSGPAYLFYFMECMQDSGIALGLSAADSYLLTLQTMAGAARLAQEQNQSFEELRANVTSKGGTTERAINCLFDNNFKGIIDEAIRAAAARASEISNSSDQD